MKSTNQLSIFILVLLLLFSCKNQQYVFKTIQKNDQEEQFEKQDFHDSDVASEITFNQNINEQNQSVITSNIQTQSNKKAFKYSVTKKQNIKQLITPLSDIQAIHDSKPESKQQSSVPRTTVYSNLSKAGDLMGILAFVFAFINSSLGIFLGTFCILFGLIAIIGITGFFHRKITSNIKTSRRAIWGIFVGILSIIISITLMAI